MAFLVDVDKINEWRSRQRSRLDPHPLPSLPGLKIGRSPTHRAFNLLYAALMLGLPVGIFIFVLIPLLPVLGSGAPSLSPT
jgi:hypothetical protein